MEEIFTVQYLLLIYDQEKRWTGMSPAEQGADMEKWMAFGQEFQSAIRGGNALQPVQTGKTVRVRDGKPQVTDGPFAETKEQLGGYYLVEAADEAEAIRIAAKIPWSPFGSIEVRPVMVFS